VELFFFTLFCILVSTVHIHQGSPNAPIRSDFILGKCKEGSKCPGHHRPLPFLWQYKLIEDNIWKRSSVEDNVKLEKLYCDVMVEECSAFGFQISVEG